MTSDKNPNLTVKALQERLRLLEDKQELHELLDQYCKTPDRHDFQGHANTYAEDGQQQYGPWGAVKGRDNIARIIKKNESNVVDQLHYMTNMRFEIDGDTATGTSYLIMVVIRDAEKRTDTLWQGGPYEWKFLRTEEGWRIKTMKLQATWMNREDPLGVFSTAMKV
ncbi:hypothetical protein N7509_003820 [Penicillium cosmopolitanum]|uniref:SnoaL-like domain-containing protein n=1 Tax=Penicillium cosmopolitanum TaxID=1131564 RepID=A0A9X0BBV0_9EURO|nr:uncharacterized protein N7509_003820 [Penicillium cosmopolitanum]KAJ5403949.1 hypothetical protein N7509_003820 [Penicillium cosmopolitanum]